MAFQTATTVVRMYQAHAKNSLASLSLRNLPQDLVALLPPGNNGRIMYREVIQVGTDLTIVVVLRHGVCPLSLRPEAPR